MPTIAIYKQGRAHEKLFGDFTENEVRQMIERACAVVNPNF